MTSSRSLVGFSSLLQFFRFIGYVTSGAITPSTKPSCIGGGVITPGWTFPQGDIFLEVGSPLEIHCSLDFDNPDTKGYTAKDIVFRKGDEKVDSKYVTVLNESTARLYVDNLSKNDPNEYYYCSLVLYGDSRPKSSPQAYPVSLKPLAASNEPPEQLVCLNYVAINSKEPKEVRNFACDNYNWQTLKCTWREPVNMVETNYTIVYWIARKSRNNPQYECAIRDDASCTWTTGTVPRFRPFFNYLYFQINGVNKFGNTSQTFKFNNFQNVVPAAPTEVVVLTKTTHSIHLQWNIGMWAIFDTDLDYMVKYAVNSTQDWTIKRYHGKDAKTFNDTVQVNVTDLSYPNTAFEFRVYMKSPLAGEDYWSEPATVVLKTGPCAAHMSPQTDLSTFEIYSEYRDHRDVLVYWKQMPIDEHNADDYDFKISVWENNVKMRNLRPVFVSCSYAKFTKLSFQSHKFLFRSTSRVGFPPQSSTIYLPRKQDVLPKPEVFIKVDKGDGTYHLSWKWANTIDTDGIANVTLFWCESNREYSHPCASPFNWTYLSPASLEYHFKGSPDAGYEFAISISSRKYSSGMSWASCVLPPNQLSKIKYVWADEVGSSFTNLKWKSECSEHAKRIEGYKLAYCPVKETDRQICAQLEKTLVVYGNRSVDYANITNLRPSTTYKISVLAFTDTLFGPPSVNVWSRTRDETSFEDIKATESTSDINNAESVWDMMGRKALSLRSLSNENYLRDFD